MPENDAPLTILYDDGALVAVAKPAGEPVIAARGEPPEACVQKRLERQLRRRVYVVHRIDKDASGVVVFALDAESHRAASLAFEHRRVDKRYLAFVAGALEPVCGTLRHATAPRAQGKDAARAPGRDRSPGRRHRATRRGAASRSATARSSLVEARPETGRHHQIRVHLRAAGAPILFDPLYGRGLMPAAIAEAPCTRLALHAERVEIEAQDGSVRLAVEAPLAPDLVALTAWLEAHARAE